MDKFLRKLLYLNALRESNKRCPRKDMLNEISLLGDNFYIILKWIATIFWLFLLLMFDPPMYKNRKAIALSIMIARQKTHNNL